MREDCIYGINAVLEALQSGVEIQVVYLAVGLRESVRSEFERLARARGVTLMRADKTELDRLAGRGARHQGVVAEWGRPAEVDLEDLVAIPRAGRSVLLCLDEIQDPRNLGALARSAWAFGAAGLVLPERRSAPVSPAAVKASAGALCHLPLAREKNLGRALDRLKELGFWVCGAVVEGGQAPWEFDPGERIALVLGSEGAGLRAGIEGRLDFRVRVPMVSGAESLNVSVAGALLLYEWLVRPRTGV